MNSSSESWSRLFTQCWKGDVEIEPEFLLGALTESLQPLFSDGKESEKESTPKLQKSLGREARKRFFIRFLFTEVGRISDDIQAGRLRKVSLSEERVTVSFPDLTLTGRIDRVDVTRDANTGHLLAVELIDYKTSKLPRKESELVLFPSPLFQPTKQKLSIQGGVYTLAWSQRQSQLVESSEKMDLPVSFSLHRLGSLDWEKPGMLTATLPLQTIEGQRELKELFDTYSSAANQLAQGHFPAKPISEMTCGYCSYKAMCPEGRKA